MHKPILGSGLCECGCGERTRIAQHSKASTGIVAGQPYRFMPGHRAHTGPVAFWAHVHQTDECWVWTGNRRPTGYGLFGKHSAHRLMFETACGPVAEGLEVCHSCDIPPCVNPAHLFLGTHQENMDDMASKGRRIAKLSFEDVRQIRALRARGSKLQPLADRFDVSISMVSLIVRGQARTAHELELAERWQLPHVTQTGLPGKP
jgi:hypothetical protein